MRNLRCNFHKFWLVSFLVTKEKRKLQIKFGRSAIKTNSYNKKFSIGDVEILTVNRCVDEKLKSKFSLKFVGKFFN